MKFETERSIQRNSFSLCSNFSNCLLLISIFVNIKMVDVPFFNSILFFSFVRRFLSIFSQSASITGVCFHVLLARIRNNARTHSLTHTNSVCVFFFVLFKFDFRRKLTRKSFSQYGLSFMGWRILCAFVYFLFSLFFLCGIYFSDFILSHVEIRMKNKNRNKRKKKRLEKFR